MNSVNSSRNLPSENISSPLSVLEKPTPKVLIYADGSCLKNGSEHAQAGAGVVLMTENRRCIKLKACYLGALTKQKAEILACAIGLESLKYPAQIQIFSDSKYVIETMAGKNRMKSNREFWQRLIKACMTHAHRVELDTRTRRICVSGNCRPSFACCRYC